MQLLTLLWTDINGREQYTHLRLVDGADPADIIAALQAHSGAAITEWAIGSAHEVLAAPSGDLLSSVGETAGLRFCTPLATCTDLHLRAPNLAVFVGGASQVDTTVIDDIVGVVLGVLTDRGGVAVTSYRGGWRGGGKVDAG